MPTTLNAIPDTRLQAGVMTASHDHLRALEAESTARRARGGRLRRGVRRRAARRGAVASQGADLLVARYERTVGSEEPAARAVAPVEQPPRSRRKHSRLSAVELDRDRRLEL